MKLVGVVTQLWTFPVKSMAGSSVHGFDVHRLGPAWDHNWMVFDGDGRMITQRTVPSLQRIHASVVYANTLMLVAKGSSLGLDAYAGGDERRARVWSDDVQAISASLPVDAWISAHAGVACSLVRMMGSRTNDKHAPLGETRLTDGFPLTIATERSLAELQTVAPAILTMERFRPNIVIKSELLAWEEERWKRLRIGKIDITIPKPCRRCPMIDVDPSTGVATTGVFEALKKLRAADGEAPSFDGKPYFGVKAMHEGIGYMHVGQPVYVEES